LPCVSSHKAYSITLEANGDTKILTKDLIILDDVESLSIKVCDYEENTCLKPIKEEEYKEFCRSISTFPKVKNLKVVNSGTTKITLAA
jgi:hypothetical protein